METSMNASDTNGDALYRSVLDRIASQRTQLRSQGTWTRPGNIGRCLLMAIRDEGLDSTILDRVLAPYWSVLWGLAARGHWVRHEHLPVRTDREIDDVRHEIRLPDPKTADEITVSVDSTQGLDLAMVIDLGPTRRFAIALTQYPELVEFRAMVDGLSEPPWNGRYFHTDISLVAGLTIFKVTCKKTGIQFELSHREMVSLRDLLQELWQRPEVTRWLSELQLEYGEQSEIISRGGV
jgi:hypothetical protein